MRSRITGFVHQPSPGLRLAGQPSACVQLRRDKSPGLRLAGRPSAYVPQSRDYGETSCRGECPRFSRSEIEAERTRRRPAVAGLWRGKRRTAEDGGRTTEDRGRWTDDAPLLAAANPVSVHDSHEVKSRPRRRAVVGLLRCLQL